MHIKIENDNNKVEAVLCIERGHDVARILHSEPEHIRSLVNIAKTLGASLVIVEAEIDTLGMYEDLGFTPSELVVTVWKVLNETKSKRG